jgi:peroxiredoxin
MFTTYGLTVGLLAAVALVTLSAGAKGDGGQNGPEGRVAVSADDIHPLLVGMKVPEVTLTNLRSQPVTLYSLIEKKQTVLVFYRGGWCPYCNLQLEQLHVIEDEVLKLGYQIVAVSADRPENAEKSLEKHDLKYTLLSDSAKAAAKAFGLAFKVDDKTLEAYKKFGINLTEASGVDDHILPVPAVFIVRTDGMIVFEYVNPNYKVRLNAQVLLAILKAENEESGRGR